MTTTKTVKPGDYFYTSWGYDETHINYLVVVGVSPSGKTALCRAVRKIDAGSDCKVYDNVMPGEAYGEPFRMRIRPDGCLRGSYPHWEGHKGWLDTFHPTQFGKSHYETNSLFGR